MNTERQIYITPTVNINRFKAEDIIATSYTNNSPYDDDPSVSDGGWA